MGTDIYDCTILVKRKVIGIDPVTKNFPDDGRIIVIRGMVEGDLPVIQYFLPDTFRLYPGRRFEQLRQQAHHKFVKGVNGDSLT
jgi:hypothetical protein